MFSAWERVILTAEEPTFQMEMSGNLGCTTAKYVRRAGRPDRPT